MSGMFLLGKNNLAGAEHTHWRGFGYRSGRQRLTRLRWERKYLNRNRKNLHEPINDLNKALLKSEDN